ncbi:cytochrome P450 [Peniophora sp. CONT]|nr:cytochrome P450 [Peniophora sp. CONT]
MAHAVSFLDIAAIVALAYIAKRLLFRSKLTPPLPPGPSGLPLIGNALDLPQTEPYKVYVDWGRQYGPIMHVSVLGQPIVIVNNLAIATELLERRATLYSERPTLPMAGELSGWDNALVLQHYDDRWRAYRRHFHSFIGARVALKRHSSLLEYEARLLAQRLMAAPEKLEDSIRNAAAGVILKITYGYDTLPEKDPVVELVNESMAQFGDVSESSKVWLVDLFPILKNVPTWCPGAGFRKTAQHYQETILKMAQVPFDIVKSQMEDNTAQPSMLSDLLEQSEGTADDIYTIKWSAASMYAGGADTSVSTMLSLFLCMSLFPEIQKKAQEEIDLVIGRDRLPTLSDRPSLPYIEALVSEVMRWAPVAPMGIPHKLVQDDVYDGYHIPAGSLILPNVYAMLRDPEVYANPEAFQPERFIAQEGKPAEPNPRSSFFGFGRRICPGRELADVSVWTETAVALATLSISKARDENGEEITPSTRFTDGTVVHPEAFKCNIRARWPYTGSLVAQELTQFHRSRD